MPKLPGGGSKSTSSPPKKKQPTVFIKKGAAKIAISAAPAIKKMKQKPIARTASVSYLQKKTKQFNKSSRKIAANRGEAVKAVKARRSR